MYSGFKVQRQLQKSSAYSAFIHSSHFPSSQPRHRGYARPFLTQHNSQLLLLARTPNRSKTIKAWSRASFPRPPLLPHLLHLSSSCSLTLHFSFAPATLPRYSSPLRLNPILFPCPASNPVPSTSDHPIPSPQSPKEPSAKGLIIGFFRAPCTGSVLSHVSCGVSNR